MAATPADQFSLDPLLRERAFQRICYERSNDRLAAAEAY